MTTGKINKTNIFPIIYFLFYSNRMNLFYYFIFLVHICKNKTNKKMQFLNRKYLNKEKNVNLLLAKNYYFKKNIFILRYNYNFCPQTIKITFFAMIYIILFY